MTVGSAQGEQIDRSGLGPLELKIVYPPGVLNVFFTCQAEGDAFFRSDVNYDTTSGLQIGRLTPEGTIGLSGLLGEFERFGLKGIEAGTLVRRVIEGMLAQWGAKPEMDPPATNMWTCALKAAHTYLLGDNDLCRRLFLAMVVCQGGREKSPTGLVRAILFHRPKAVSLQEVISNLLAYGCKPEEIVHTWKKMLLFRFKRGFGTQDIVGWWQGLKVGDVCFGSNIAEEVNRLCAMRDLQELIATGMFNAIQPDSIGLISVDAQFLATVEKICSLCNTEWRLNPSTSDTVEKMLVTCLSRGNVARAFQMLAQFGSYFGLCHRGMTTNIVDKESLARMFNQLIRNAINRAVGDNNYGVACALAEYVDNVRLANSLRTPARNKGQKIALNFEFFVHTAH